MKRWLLGAAALGAVAGGGIIGGATFVSASIPAEDGTITACVGRGGGVRIIDAATTSCKTAPASQAEQTLTWVSRDTDTDTYNVFVDGASSAAATVDPVTMNVTVRSDCPDDTYLAIGRDFSGLIDYDVLHDGYPVELGALNRSAWEVAIRVHNPALAGASVGNGWLKAICVATVSS